MSNSLTSTPSTFMRLMKYVLHVFIGRYVVVYFDNILLYNKSINEHIEHLWYMFNALKNENIYVNLKKV